MTQPAPRAWLRVLLPLLLGASLLSGCTVSREHVRQAEVYVAASIDHRLSCSRADHCAMDSRLRTLASPSKAAAPGAASNRALLLEQGQDALIARLNLIRSARRSIDIQTFLWVADDAGNLMLDELMRAARRGVKVRVIIDQIGGAFGGVRRLARIARSHVNFRLRLYNPTLNDSQTQYLEYLSSSLCCFFQINQRMHNKLLLVDDMVGITGGRNYQNRYFDWDNSFVFRDRDVLVAGPVAIEMAESFDTFWQHPRSTRLTHLRDVNERLRRDGPHAPGWSPPAWHNGPRVELALAAAVSRDYVAEHFLGQVFELERVSYFSDLPAKTAGPQFPGERELTAHLMDLLGDTREEIVLQTPYLVISEKAQKIFRNLYRHRPQVDVLVSTNSLASTDAFAVYALSHKYKRRYLQDFGFEIHEFKPHPAEGPRIIADFAELTGNGEVSIETGSYQPVPLETAGLRISMHAKSLVVDGEFVMIGSHNFDPRSHEYNTESGIVAHDRSLAETVRAAILRDMLPGNSWVIAPRRGGNILTRANRAIAYLSEKLPIFDFWPIRYSTSYDIDPGCQPMSPSEPGFYACYHPVGDFPKVKLSLKAINTRIFTAFGAGLSGVM